MYLPSQPDSYSSISKHQFMQLVWEQSTVTIWTIADFEFILVSSSKLLEISDEVIDYIYKSVCSAKFKYFKLIFMRFYNLILEDIGTILCQEFRYSSLSYSAIILQSNLFNERISISRRQSYLWALRLFSQGYWFKPHVLPLYLYMNFLAHPCHNRFSISSSIISNKLLSLLLFCT